MTSYTPRFPMSDLAYVQNLTREQAEAHSLRLDTDPETGRGIPCEDCDGRGLTFRFFQDRRGTYHRIVLACFCPHGDKIALVHYSEAIPKGNRPAILSLRECPGLWGLEHKLPPEWRDHEDDARYVDLFKRRAWEELGPVAKRKPGRRLFGDLPPCELQALVTPAATPMTPEPEPELAF